MCTYTHQYSRYAHRQNTLTGQASMEHIQHQLAQIEQRITKEEKRLVAFLHAITRYVGGLWFLIANTVLLLGWIEWNVGWFGLPIFDPYPFGLLALIFAFEAVAIGALVLMNQAHSMRRTATTHRVEKPHHDYDANLHTILREPETPPRLSTRPDVIQLPESKSPPREITLEEIQREIERNSDF